LLPWCSNKFRDKSALRKTIRSYQILTNYF